jgi:hypothetical protein
MADETKRPWEQRVHEELRRVIDYINDEVVPEVRRSGSAALRTAARELDKLAQHMDDAKAQRERESGDGPPTGGSSPS